MAAFIAHALQFLNQKRAKTSATKWLARFHVDVAIMPVVMEQDATARCYFALDFDNSMPPELTAGNIGSLFRRRLTKYCSNRPMRGAHLVMKEHGFAGHWP